MISIEKTEESPCRTCENIDQDKEECATYCPRLRAFQTSLLQNDEDKIKEFQVRYVAHVFARKFSEESMRAHH